MGRRAKGVNLVFPHPITLLHRGFCSVNIITKEMEVKGFLAALIDTSAQNMKARAPSGKSVLPF